MERILVIGCPGSRKKHLGAQVARVDGIASLSSRSDPALPKTQLPQVYKLLARVGGGKEFLIFHSRTEADEWIKTIEERA